MSPIRAFLAASMLLVLSAGVATADHGYWPDGGVDPATDTVVADSRPSPTLWGIGLALGIAATVAALASLVRRAASVRP